MEYKLSKAANMAAVVQEPERLQCELDSSVHAGGSSWNSKESSQGRPQPVDGPDETGPKVAPWDSMTAAIPERSGHED
jgi:hypothetical protein